MSVRPAQKVQVCNAPDSPLFVHDEICLLDAAGNTVEAMRLRTYDPLTLALRAERVINILTGGDATGTPVACPCGNGGGGTPATNVLTFANGTLTSVVNGQSAAVVLRGQLLQSLGGVQLGYLLPL
jgi:hypothetical protein